jgi:methyl-accepting chemotaxis protein
MEEFITLIQGPAAATVVMGIILYTVWKFVVDTIVPRVDQSLKESNDRYKEMVSEHKEDREMFVQTIERITARIDKMNDVTDDMAKSVEGLHKSVSEIHQKLQKEREDRSHGST